MNGNTQPSTVFSRLDTGTHLIKPSSPYSRMIICDQKSQNSFVNFKIEIMGNVQKQELNDTGLWENSSTPAKTPISLRTLSPDQGCFVDSRADIKKMPLQVTQPYFDSILCLNPLNVASSREAEKKDILEPLEDEDWNIGAPLFESSAYEGMTEDVAKDLPQVVALQPVGEDQPTFIREDSIDTSYEPTLLHVKVKSIVVKPNSCGETAKKAESVGCERPVVFKTEEEWDREKAHYVNAVMRHINEKPADQGVVGELMNLMMHVADETSGSSRQWQHPSDMTIRNYQRRFGNTAPKLCLNEWVLNNGGSMRRFKNIPKIFKRSPIP